MSEDQKGAGQQQTDFLKLSDYESFEMFFHAENTTTSTKIDNPQIIRMTEIRDDGCALILPARSCAEGHFLLFKTTIKELGDLEFTAKVNETRLNKAKEGEVQTLVASLTFYQIDRSKWEKLQKLFHKRQEALSKIISNIKD